jgi:Co/Zn/Cd efflux system component
MLGLIGVALGWVWADAIAGIVVTGFICHVGYEVTADIAHRLLDGVDPDIITTAETMAAAVPGVRHAHARARWTGRTLRVEVRLPRRRHFARNGRSDRPQRSRHAGATDSGHAQLYLDGAGRLTAESMRTSAADRA